MTDTVLIVGPDGFLASQLLQRLALLPHVTVIGLGKRAESGNLKSNYYNDFRLLKKEHPEIELIFLLGSYIPYGKFHVPHTDFITDNIQIVAELSLSYPDARIVFSSSVSVYGTPAQLPIGLSSPFCNPDLYGLSKLAGEAIVRNHKRYAIIRFSSIIGRGMRALTMIPKMIEASHTGTITVQGEGSRLQNYIDVRDAAEMCLQAAKMDENIIVLGVGERSYTNLEVANYIKSLTQANIEFTGKDSSPSFVYDSEESYRILDFRPGYSLEQSLNDIIRK